MEDNELIGKTFGRLTVVSIAPCPEHLKQKSTHYYCTCSCNPKIVVNKPFRKYSLLSGATTSCGCLNKEKGKKLEKKIEYGTKFEKIQVLNKIENYKKPGAWYECKCDCGNPDILSCKATDIRAGRHKSCGRCGEFEYKNKKFGRLTTTDICIKKNNKIYYYCDCECGKKDILVSLDHLKSGHTKSCGCYNLDKLKEKRVTNKYIISDDYEYGIGYTNTGDSFIFDKEDYELIKNYIWNKNKNGYIVSTSKDVIMARLIMNAPSNMKVDHINHITTDNRKCNLRICTHQQNIWNTKKPKNNTSGYKGVFYNKRTKLWDAKITVNRQDYFYSGYSTPEEAYVKRLELEEKYYGEYAYHLSVGGN